jgi:hypothetical protein
VFFYRQFLDRFYLSRVGMRVLVGQHIMLHHPQDGFIGTLFLSLLLFVLFPRRFYWYSFFVIIIFSYCSQDGFIGTLLYFVCFHCLHPIVREKILVEDTFYWYPSVFCVFSLCSPHPVVFGVTV